MRSYEVKLKVNDKIKKIVLDCEDQLNEDQLNEMLISMLKQICNVEINQIDKSIKDDIKEAEFELQQYINRKGLNFSIIGLVEAYEKQAKGFYISKSAKEAILDKKQWINILSSFYHG